MWKQRRLCVGFGRCYSAKVRSPFSNIKRPLSPVKSRKNFNAEPVNKALRMASHINTSVGIMPQYFDYFLVLDFEATCEEGEMIQPCQEIIEFPVMQLCTRTFEPVRQFHTYVRPTERPQLTSFCTQLTGIIQGMLDDQPTLPAALKLFDRWVQEGDLVSKRFAFVTCGDWDLQLMLPRESEYKGIEVPSIFSSWINVKKSFCDHRGYFAQGMKHLLTELELQHVGRFHSGIDDVHNIAAITRSLANEGYLYQINGGKEMEKRKFGGL